MSVQERKEKLNLRLVKLLTKRVCVLRALRVRRIVSLLDACDKASV